MPLPSTWQLVQYTLPFSIQLNMIVAFIAGFIHLLEGSVSPIGLCLLSGSVSMLCWLLTGLLAAGGDARTKTPIKTQSRRRLRRRSPAARQVGRLLSLFLLVVVLYALTPVLRTLTEATTSDSIWALTATLLAVNIAFADHSTPSTSSGSASDGDAHSTPRPRYIIAGRDPNAGGGLAVQVSFNAAVCASVVLASRLKENPAVFALLSLSMQIFAFVPSFRRRLSHSLRRPRSSSGGEPPAPDAATVSLVNRVVFCVSLLVAVFGLAALEATYGKAAAGQRRAVRSGIYLHLGTIIFVSGICPLWMRRAQSTKRRLNGPWDPAVPLVRPPER